MKTKYIIILLAVVAVAATAFLSKQYYHYAYCNFVARDTLSHTYEVYPDMSLDSVLNRMDQDYRVQSELSWD